MEKGAQRIPALGHVAFGGPNSTVRFNQPYFLGLNKWQVLYSI